MRAQLKEVGHAPTRAIALPRKSSICRKATSVRSFGLNHQRIYYLTPIALLAPFDFPLFPLNHQSKSINSVSRQFGSFIRFRLIRCPRYPQHPSVYNSILEGLVVYRGTPLPSMKTVALALLSVLGSTAAQGVTQSVAPSASPPPGCVENYPGNFEVQVIQPMSKRDVFRVCRGPLFSQQHSNLYCTDGQT